MQTMPLVTKTLHLVRHGESEGNASMREDVHTALPELGPNIKFEQVLRGEFGDEARRKVQITALNEKENNNTTTTCKP